MTSHNSGFSTLHPFLKAMIITNVVVFVLSLVFSLLSGITPDLSLNPMMFLSPSSNVLKFLGASGVWAAHDGHQSVLWTFISANWLHGSLLHLVFNMVALAVIVPLVIQGYGKYRMFTIYTLSGILGFYLSFKAGIFSTVGASAGICGMIGAALVFGKTSRHPYAAIIYRQTTGWVVTLVLIGFFIPNINNWAHGGGLIAGMGLGWLFGILEKRKENRLDRVLSMGCIALTLAVLGRAIGQAIFVQFL